MKLYQKLFSIVFAMLILASQSGMAFNIHFCKGVIASISVFEYSKACGLDTNSKHIEIKKCCNKKQSITENKCCKNSEIDLKKIASEELLTKVFSFEFSPFFILNHNTTVPFLFFDSIETTQSFFKLNFASNAPPLYKLYCKYILYA
jgi:hypothetical protein